MNMISQAFALTFDIESHTFDMGNTDILGQSEAKPSIAEKPRQSQIDEADIPILSMDELRSRGDPQGTSAAPEVAQGLFGGLVALAQQVSDGVQWALFVPENQPEDESSQSVSVSVVPRPSLYERNRTEAENLCREIDGHLRTLDLQLEQNDAHHQRVMPPPTLQPVPTLTSGDHVNRWYHQILGAGTATTSALGWGTVAAGLPYVTGWVTDSFFASGAALLGAGYLGATTVRDLPSNAQGASANRMIRSTMDTIRPLQDRLNQLTQEETARQNAMERVTTVIAEHSQRIRQLVDVLNTIEVASKASVESQPILEHARVAEGSVAVPGIGNGEQHQHSLSMLMRAQQTFQSFFSTINANAPTTEQYRISRPFASLGYVVGYGLTSLGEAIHHIKETASTLLDRYTAYRAEIAYQDGEGKALIQALTTPAHDSRSIVQTGGDIKAKKNYQEACDVTPPSLKEIRKQLHMGENIARALVTSEVPTPGVVVCQGDNNMHVTVTSNLTTTRALAWYLDTAADVAESAREPSTPSVRRLADNSLLIDDPDSHLYDFLMQAPTAHTTRMVTAKKQDGPVEPGVFRLHDYYAGFPRGSHGVQFERTLDDKTGASILRMRLLNEPATFGIQPAIISMQDDDHIVHSERAAESPRLHNHSILATDDYQSLPKEDLPVLRAYFNAELERQVLLREAGHQQLERLENWENPLFRQNLA